MKKHLRWIVLALAVCAAVLVAGCGDDEESGDGESANGTLVVYSGRDAELVGPLYEKFEKQTGIKVEVRYGESPELAATIAEEGDNARADVFYAQDAGAIGSLEAKGMLAPLPRTAVTDVPQQYRSDHWTAITGRVRVLAYNTESVSHGDLPAKVTEMTDPKWRGRLAIAPGNASFQAFVTAMRDVDGDDATRQFLQGLKDNDVKTYEGNSAIVEAIGRGEVDAGLVNHYYLFQLKAEDPDAPVDNHFFEAGDPGALVNVSAAGIVKGANNPRNAEKFLEFALNQGQRYFATEAEEREYPVVPGFEGDLAEGLKPLAEVKGPDVDLHTFGEKLPDTVKLIDSIGFPGT